MAYRSSVWCFDVLPGSLLRVIVLALPVDARARLACVCRASWAFLADSSLWQVLDLTPAGGVAAERLLMKGRRAFVRGAVARAAGQLCVLNVNVHSNQIDRLLVSVITSDGAELQRVSTETWLDVEQVDSVLAATPRLEVLTARMADCCTALIPVLENDSSRYGPLRVSQLDVEFESDESDESDDDDEVAVNVLALAAAVAAHEPLKGLILRELKLAPGLNALMDAAAERRVSRLTIGLGCFFNDESVPTLARLLQRNSLTKLEVFCDWFPQAPESSLQELWSALRACSSLTLLRLRLGPPGGASRDVVTGLLDAAATLPTLSELDLWDSKVQDKVATGRALGALLAADLPSLRTLRLNSCRLGDQGMAPLLIGVAANMHLRMLDCCDENQLSAAFERERVVPILDALEARTELDEEAEQLRERLAATAAARDVACMTRDAALATATHAAAQAAAQVAAVAAERDAALRQVESARRDAAAAAHAAADMIDALGRACSARDAAQAAAMQMGARLIAVADERNTAVQAAYNAVRALGRQVTQAAATAAAHAAALQLRTATLQDAVDAAKAERDDALCQAAVERGRVAQLEAALAAAAAERDAARSDAAAARQAATASAAALASVTAERDAVRLAGAEVAAQIATLAAERDAAAADAVAQHDAAVRAVARLMAQAACAAAVKAAEREADWDLAGAALDAALQAAAAARRDAQQAAAGQMEATTRDVRVGMLFGTYAEQHGRPALLHIMAPAFAAGRANGGWVAAAVAPLEAAFAIDAAAVPRLPPPAVAVPPPLLLPAPAVPPAPLMLPAPVAAAAGAIVPAIAGPPQLLMPPPGPAGVAAASFKRKRADDAAVGDPDAEQRPFKRLRAHDPEGVPPSAGMHHLAAAAAVPLMPPAAVAPLLLLPAPAAAAAGAVVPANADPLPMQRIPTHDLAGMPPSTGTHYVFHGGVAQRSTAWPTALRGVQKPRGKHIRFQEQADE
jgi:hypothetical protein